MLVSGCILIRRGAVYSWMIIKNYLIKILPFLAILGYGY